MDKPVLKLMIGDNEFRAIGHVAAQWAYIETELDYVLNMMLLHESQNEKDPWNRQSFKERIAKLRSLSNAMLSGDPLAEILDILEKVASLKGFRDDIVHGHWKLHRKGAVLTTGIQVIKSRPKYSRKETKFTAEKAEGVAAKISKESLRLVLWHSKYIRVE